MSKTAKTAVMVGGLFAAIQVGSAEAYFADSPEFAIRGGAATAVLQIELSPVQKEIRSQLADLSGGNALTQRDAEGVIAFYESRGFEPAWASDGSLTPDAQAIIARLGDAAADGLDPSAYTTPPMRAGAGAKANITLLARTDILLSVAVAAYTREAYAGRIDPRTISSDIDLDPHYPDPAAALASVATSTDAVSTLEGFNPSHPGYLALRDELARIRGEVEEERIAIPAGPTLRLGDEDDRVPILRARFELPVPADEAAIVYDEALMSAVEDFQGAAGLVTDGIVGPNTLGALNGGPAVDPEAEIIANMERWRWEPREFGSFYVQVNVPEFMVRIVDEDEVIHETRVVVGKRSNRTAIFSDEIEHMMVNPFWYVPASIIAAEYMPVLRSDPGYFVRNNYDVYARYGGSVQQVNPYEINWSMLSPSDVSMRQRPGPGNALGQIKFIFPNSHAIYLHDTPSKSLFQRDVRAFSHGCVRVMNPMEFADALLSQTDGLNAAAVTALFGDREQQVKLDTHIPVHITYFTAVVDADGRVQFKGDIYGFSAEVRSRLGLEG